jgi:hypothetical protein
LPNQLEQWIDDTGVDGLNMAFAVRPETFVDIVDMLVPELQRRGRYKTEYAKGPLRKKLFRPATAWSAASRRDVSLVLIQRL